MYTRISWGRVNPGEWEGYEQAFARATSEAGPVEGLISRTLSRDLDDPNTGYTVSVWESVEAMAAYEAGGMAGKIVRAIKPHFGGAFVTNRLEIVMDERYDQAASRSSRPT